MRGEPPALVVHIGRFADKLRAALQRRVHLAHQIIADALGCQRPDIGRVEHRVAHAQGFDLFHEVPREGVIDIGVHEEAFRRDAGLAIILVARFHGRIDRLGDIRRRHDDEGIRAAEFQQRRFQFLARNACHAAPGGA